MPRTYVLAAVLRKELTEALREKHLRMVLLVGLFFPLFFGWTFVKAEAERSGRARAGRADGVAQSADREAPAGAVPGSGQEPADGRKGRAAIGAFPLVMSVGYGMFLAAVFAITLALEGFVGERERNTIETLLGTPATDRELFFSKVLSCVLVSTALGILFGLVGSIGLCVMASAYDLNVPWGLLGRTWGYSLASLLAVSLTCASLGVIISSKVSSVKAGGQVFGALMLVVVMVFMVGGLLLEPRQEQVKAVVGVLAHMPPWTMVALPLLAAMLLNWGLLSLAARMFSRERILTGR